MTAETEKDVLLEIRGILSPGEIDSRFLSS